jgi:hypothetical protein
MLEQDADWPSSSKGEATKQMGEKEKRGTVLQPALN